MTLRLLSILVILMISSSLTHASVLTVQMPAEPTQFDPLQMENGAALKISANTLGTLFAYTGGGERVKALVDHYSVSKDRCHYTFYFKKDLKWSDGKAFHAEQFLLAIERLTLSPIKVSLSSLFPRFDLKHSRVLNSFTVEIAIDAPDNQLLNWLTLPPFAPIRKDIEAKYSDKRSPVVPSLGAYEVVEYKRDEFMRLRKNEAYYDRAKVGIEEVKIRFIGEEAALLPLLQAGSLDILSKVPVLQLEAARKVSSVLDVPVEAVTYFGFNTRTSPFDVKANRQSFRDALTPSSRDELAEALKTGEQGARYFLPAILMPAGFHRDVPGGIKGATADLKFSIQSDGGSRNQSLLEFVQGNLKTKLKWKVSLDVMDWKAHYAKLKSGPDPVYRFGWLNPVSDPFIVYEALTSQSPNNFTGWKNLDYDHRVAELRQETRMVKKAKLINQLEDILYDEAPVVPLLHQSVRFAYSKRVLGFRANSSGVILFRELRLNESVTKTAL